MPSIFDLTTSMLAPSTMSEPAAGTCTSDGQYIWRTASNGVPAHWERKQVGEQCAAYGNFSVNTQTGPHGGVTVTPGITSGAMTAQQVLAISQHLTALRTPEKLKRDAAYASTLPPCPASSVSGSSSAPACYDIGAQYADASLPPGSFYSLPGVVHNIAELTGQDGDGSFRKQFIPDADQRTWIEAKIVGESVGQLKKAIAQLQLGMLSPGTFASTTNYVRQLSVNDFLKRVPSFTMTWPNFTATPIKPTGDELDGTGGLQKYLARGGYFISIPVIQGQIPIGDAVGEAAQGNPAACISPSCACPDPTYGARPRCIGAFVTTKGLVRGSVESGDWYQYVAVDQNYFYSKLQHKDANWLVQAGEWLAKQIQDVFDALCANRGVIEGQLQAQQSQICVDAANHPCTSGQKGCVCQKPSPYAQAGTSAFGIYMNQFCGAVASYDPQQLPNYEPPPSIPLVQTIKLPTFGLAIAAGLAIGALAFGNR